MTHDSWLMTHDHMTTWLMTTWLMTTWLMTTWLITTWLQTTWLQTIWLMTTWLMTTRVQTTWLMTCNYRTGFSPLVWPYCWGDGWRRRCGRLTQTWWSPRTGGVAVRMDKTQNCKKKWSPSKYSKYMILCKTSEIFFYNLEFSSHLYRWAPV